MTLRDIPALRAEAERRARAFLAVANRVFLAAGWDTEMIHGGEDYAEDALLLFTDVHLDILTDLTDPDSRATVARLVAEKVGLDTSGGVLLLHQAIGRHPWYWRLDMWEDERDFAEPGCETESTRIDVPGISAITDPAEALLLIALRVLGGES